MHHPCSIHLDSEARKPITTDQFTQAYHSWLVVMHGSTNVDTLLQPGGRGRSGTATAKPPYPSPACFCIPLLAPDPCSC